MEEEEEEEEEVVVRVRLRRAGEGARELFPWTAGPGTHKYFDPEHPLAGDSKGRSLALVLCLIHFVWRLPPSHYVSRTHCRSPAFSHACALAWMSMNVRW